MPLGSSRSAAARQPWPRFTNRSTILTRRPGQGGSVSRPLFRRPARHLANRSPNRARRTDRTSTRAVLKKMALKCGDKSGPGWDRRSRALSVEGTDVWRSWEYWRNAAIAVGCTGIRRALWCLASRIKITPESRSTSSTVETDGLAHAHSFSGHGHQPDQRVIRRDGQRPWTLRCRRNQPGDVGARNLVGRRATAPTDQQIAWRHRQCGVEAVQLACESSHHRQSLLPTGMVARPAAGWPTASAASTVGVDAPTRSRSSMNADSNRAWPSNLKPATNEQLRLDFGAQLAAHRPPPGHGRATTRRAARSSLA